MQIVIICVKAMTPEQHPNSHDAASKGDADMPHQMVHRAIPSRDLLQGEPCVLIEHGGALYSLRATRAGKLILTK